MSKFIIEIDEKILEDMQKILKGEVGLEVSEPTEVLELVLKEGFSSYDYTNPHLDEVLIAPFN